MSLKQITRGKIESPLRTLIVGVPGIGKSTFAAASKAPVFIPVEEGTGNLDVARFPAPTEWGDITLAIEELTNEPHDFHTLVIDTVDAVEPLVWKHVCERDKQVNIESYGYGKGYVAALTEWRSLLSKLEQLRSKRSMDIILIAHSVIRLFNNPEGENYDRYEMKLNTKAGGLLKEWCDSVLFAHYETFAVKSGQKSKGVSSGMRVIETQYNAAWDAKNRHGLPATLPLNYEDFASAMRAHVPLEPTGLKLAISVKLEQLADEKLTQLVKDAVKKYENNIEKLAEIDNRLSVKLAQKEAVA